MSDEDIQLEAVEFLICRSGPGSKLSFMKKHIRGLRESHLVSLVELGIAERTQRSGAPVRWRVPGRSVRAARAVLTARAIPKGAASPDHADAGVPDADLAEGVPEAESNGPEEGHHRPGGTENLRLVPSEG